MPKASTAPAAKSVSAAPHPAVEVYSPAAKTFHWLTVAFILVQLPLGAYMAWYARKTEFADPSNTLYDLHKVIGMLILVLIVARFGYRLIAGAPRPEPTIEPWQRVVSGLTHWAIYAMLLVTPVLGWLGTSYYGAMEPFGIKLPSLVKAPATDAIKEANEKYSETVFEWHEAAAFILLALVLLHFAAAMYHHVVRKDNVLRRMMPGAEPRT